MKSRLVTSISALAWLMIAAIPIALVAPGCQGRECEGGTFTDYGYNANEGHLVDPNTWESTPNNGTWLYFGPYDVWVFHPIGLEGRDIAVTNIYYSADSNPNGPGSNFTTGAGNGATVNISADSRSVFVGNSTCAPTYVRAVFQADPTTASAPLDAGTSAAIEAGDSLDAGDASD